MPNILKRILYVLGGILFFLLTFVLGVYWTFPYDHVKEFIEQEVERPAGPGGRRVASGRHLDIEELSPSWLTGVEATGVRFWSDPTEPEGHPSRLALDEASARVSLLSLLAGDLSVDFEVVPSSGGHIEGTYEEEDEGRVIQAEIQDINLRRLGPLQERLPLPISGKLNGTIDLTLPADVRESSGSVEASISRLTIGDGESQLTLPGMSSGLTVDPIRAGNLRAQLEVQRGVANIRRLSTQGEHAQLRVAGTINLANPLPRSTMNVLLRLKFEDAYRESSDRTRGLFSLMDLSPQVRPARTSDGALQYRFQGSPAGRVRATPSGRADMPD